MTSTQPARGPAARTKLVLTSTAIGLTGSVGVVLVTAVAVYAFAKIAAIALVLVELELGGGSFG